jgi:F0F1-type ATP synthase membrane subunit b/b'
MIKHTIALSTLSFAALMLAACGDKADTPSQAPSTEIEAENASIEALQVVGKTAETEVKAMIAEAEIEIEAIKAETQQRVEKELTEVIAGTEAKVEAAVEDVIEEAHDTVELKVQQAAQEALVDQLKSADTEDAANAIKSLF